MNRSRSGHTLFEMLIVVLVLAVLAGIVIPSASVGDARKLDTLQLAMQDALDHAQSLAYHQSAAYGVRFHVTGQWFGVINEVGVPIDDPLSHGDYVIKLKSPAMPSNLRLDYAMFGVRPVAAFDSKGVLIEGGEVDISAGSTVRHLECDTATAKLTETEPGNP